jgi:hypothetical protein
MHGVEMSIYALEVSKKLRVQGKRLGRAGMSERVFTLVDEFNENRTYKNAIVLAGKLKAIAQASKCDGYWDEKCSIGFRKECEALEDVTQFGTHPHGKSWWIK